MKSSDFILERFETNTQSLLTNEAAMQSLLNPLSLWCLDFAPYSARADPRTVAVALVDVRHVITFPGSDLDRVLLCCADVLTLLGSLTRSDLTRILPCADRPGFPVQFCLDSC